MDRESAIVIVAGLTALALLFAVLYVVSQTRLTRRLCRLLRRGRHAVDARRLRQCPLTLCVLPEIAIFTSAGLLSVVLLLTGELDKLWWVAPLRLDGAGISLMAWIVASWWFGHAVHDRLPIRSAATILAPAACLALLCLTYAASFACLAPAGTFGLISAGPSGARQAGPLFATEYSLAMLLLVYLAAGPLVNLVLLMIHLFRDREAGGVAGQTAASGRHGGRA